MTVIGPHKPFPRKIQQEALDRQGGKCGSCEAEIGVLGKAGAAEHEFGEGAEGHHVIPHVLGGPLTKENCIVLCRSCHYSVHRGGHWRYTDQYSHIKHLPMDKKIAAIADLYPRYKR